jgi:hypothetical protein
LRKRQKRQVTYNQGTVGTPCRGGQTVPRGKIWNASNLVTVGYGKTQLKNPAGPFPSENRRVHVINESDEAG